jgi:hypothetical protein
MKKEKIDELIKELTSDLGETKLQPDLTAEEAQKLGDEALRSFLRKYQSLPPKEDESTPL